MKITPELRKALAAAVVERRIGSPAIAVRMNAIENEILKHPKLKSLQAVSDELTEKGHGDVIPRLEGVVIQSHTEDLIFRFSPSVRLYNPNSFESMTDVCLSIEEIWETEARKTEFRKVQKIQDQQRALEERLVRHLEVFNDTGDLVRTIPELEGFLISLNWTPPETILQGTIRQVRSILMVYGGDHG
ncbi:MAG: hypothetical protein EHM12_06680 [Dehalococcoidia bacterium]|nr:MAG: hypothetical protein EHM12_06680 [Dehalococcoidia bacterium]